MKTPQDWLDWLASETNNPQQKGRTHEVLITGESISTIQKDAFESGRVAGLREAALLIVHIDTYDGRKAHDTIHRVANKYQARNATPNPLKSHSL